MNYKRGFVLSLFIQILFLGEVFSLNNATSPHLFQSFFKKNQKPQEKKEQIESQELPIDPATKLVADVLPIGLASLESYYVQEPNFRQLCIKGIEKVIQKDPLLKLKVENDKLILTKQDKVIDSFSSLPSEHDFKYWVVTILNILTRAFEASPQLYTTSPEKVLSTLMKGIAQNLDEMSRYVAPHKSLPEQYVPVGTSPQENPEVTVWSQMYDSILYLRIKHFGPWTAHEVLSLIFGAKDSYNGVILDLRDNVGGRLEQAIEIADAFLGKGIIASSKGRHPDSFQRFEADRKEVIDHKPLLILTNEKSASATEVLAKALQEHKRALVVGEDTYGKGTIQRVQILPNGGAFVFTWANLFSPLGNPLNKHGVKPFIHIKHNSPQVISFLKTLTEKGLSKETFNWLSQKRTPQTTKEETSNNRNELTLALEFLSNSDLYNQALLLQEKN